MSGLSEVSLLFGQRAGDIENAREIFTAETRSFVSSILAAVQRARVDPWMNSRVRLDFPRDIETESKTGYLSSQYSAARVQLRFKKGTNFIQIADVRFGIEFDSNASAFVWQLSLVPAARYHRVDDYLWRQWRSSSNAVSLPGLTYQDKVNTIRFAQRPLSPEFTADAAFADVKTVLEFLLSADAALAEAVGVDLGPGEDTNSAAQP